MKIHTFTSKEAVYSAGDNATKLFVVNKGVVAKKGEILSAGKLLGLEMVHTMLYKPVKYVETAKALSFADLYVLEWQDFKRALELYPRVYPQIKKIAAKAIFKKHVLAFSAACQNYASDKLHKSKDHMVRMMEDELLAKKKKRLMDLKGIRVDSGTTRPSAVIRDAVQQELTKVRASISDLDQQITAKVHGLAT